MCYNAGDGQVMMRADVVEEVANALNDRFIAAGLSRFVPKDTNAVRTVSEKIDSLGAYFLASPEATSYRGRSR